MGSDKLTFFISGHRNLTQSEFDKLYLPIIKKVITNVKNPHFCVGDYEGADIMAQTALVMYGVPASNVTVYFMGNEPMNIHPLLLWSGNLKGGYNTDIERDAAMTSASTFDIAFVAEGREGSGTHQNIMRRITF